VKYAKQCLGLMKKYHRILVTGDASELWGLGGEKRAKAMKALSMLSKILGVKDRWKAIREAYGFKWSVGENASPPFLTGQTYSSLLSNACRIFKALEYDKSIVEFIALSGLRVSEALEAVKLYKSDNSDYLNRELMVLEHFKYPSIFIRRSKKAYITVLDEYMLKLLETSKPMSYNAVRMKLRRRLEGRCNLNIFRKIWATYMRLKGLDIEIIDLLQGRTPKNIFLKHYYKPDVKSLIENVRERLEGLRLELGISKP